MKFQAYVINLERSLDRLGAISTDLDIAGVKYEVVWAIDGRSLQLDTLLNYSERLSIIRHDRPMSVGEVGCFLSHLKALQTFLDSGNDVALILEDDMEVPKETGQLISEILDVLFKTNNTDWHCVHLDAGVKGFQSHLAIIHDMELNHSFYVPCKAGAILWSREGARSFLESPFAKTIMGPVDREMRSHLARTGKGFVVLPYPIKPRRFPSDIDSSGNRWAQAPKSVSSSTRSKIRRHFPDYFWAWLNMRKHRLSNPRKR